MTTSTHQIKNILNLKLLNNDINIIQIIMAFNTDFCDKCDKVCYDEITKQYCYGCKEYFKVCESCFKDNTCDSCDDWFCDECKEFRKCDNKNCCEDKKYCEDCHTEQLGYCMDCEEHKCCKKIYRTINMEGEYNYTCEECLECVFDP